MTKTFTAYIEYDPETKLYVGIIPCLKGVHTQGATLDELQHNLKEVLELCLEESQEEMNFYKIFNSQSLMFCNWV